MRLKGHFDSSPSRGFDPDFKAWESSSHDVKPYKETYTVEEENLIKQMATLCQQKGVKLIWVCPPTYKGYRNVVLNSDSMEKAMLNMATKCKAPYWIYTDIYLSQTTSNFYNMEHLNGKAANVFSHILASDLKKYMSDSTYTPDMKAISERIIN
jgi:hypothetical protein